MDSLRSLVQTTLTTMDTGETALYTCGVPKPDSLLVVGETYYGYELQMDYAGTDFNNNYIYNVRINGRLCRLYSATEDTIDIVDKALNQLLSKLKKLNFKCSANDVNLDNETKKMVVSGTVKYSEISNKLIR